MKIHLASLFFASLWVHICWAAGISDLPTETYRPIVDNLSIRNFNQLRATSSQWRTAVESTYPCLKHVREIANALKPPMRRIFKEYTEDIVKNGMLHIFHFDTGGIYTGRFDERLEAAVQLLCTKKCVQGIRISMRDFALLHVCSKTVYDCYHHSTNLYLRIANRYRCKVQPSSHYLESTPADSKRYTTA